MEALRDHVTAAMLDRRNNSMILHEKRYKSQWETGLRCHVIMQSLYTTDLKNRTGSSIYCWETEANGGHIGVTT